VLNGILLCEAGGSAGSHVHSTMPIVDSSAAKTGDRTVIAKQVSAPSAAKHEFARLVKYLVDGQDKLQRVGEVRVTNCYSDELVAGVLETLNTQAFNTRAGPDRTYHLILSVRAGEEVDSETLAKIEERVCNALGFAEHQRVSVVHHDTDNLHVHIAINKIHRTRFTIHTPYRDYHTLAKQGMRAARSGLPNAKGQSRRQEVRRREPGGRHGGAFRRGEPTRMDQA
jgi:hypothetical protein